jgi:hypothetical protein
MWKEFVWEIPAWLLVNILSIIAIGISIVAIWYTHRQLKIAGQARQDAKDAAAAQEAHVRLSAEAAERSAGAAEESVEIASQGLITAQRAYLAPSNFRSSYQNQRFSIKAFVRNFGATPAFNVRGGVHLDFKNVPPDKTIQFASIGPSTPFVRDSQETPYAFEDSVVLSPEQAEEAHRDRLLVLCWCQVYYSDIFGNPHFTRWCIRVHPREDTWDVWPESPDFLPEANQMT